MRVILAPMEGVVDATMRHLLSNMGGFDLCVTEFVRVVDRVLPDRVFFRLFPELLTDSKTATGTQVRVQLLGQDPSVIADNAARVVELGSPGCDINFGCPANAPCKQSSMGAGAGAALLKDPERIYRIVRAMRQAVPDAPVTAKIRLGWDDKSRCLEIAQAVVDGGADELTVHARTKTEGYRPPAHWEYIRQIREHVSIPVIANGDIRSREDYLRCAEISGCQDVMIGRGALAVPNLAQVIRGEQQPMPWSDVLALLRSYSEFEITGDKGQYYPNRIKQWLKSIASAYPQGDSLFRSVRTLKRTEEILAVLNNSDQRCRTALL